MRAIKVLSFLVLNSFIPLVVSISSSSLCITEYPGKARDEKVKVSSPTIFRGGSSRNVVPSTTQHQSQKHSSSSAVVNGIKNFIASGLAAACSKTLLQPLDTIKTMQQHVRSSSTLADGGKALGLVEAARLVMKRKRGVFELYAGLGVSALGSMPSVGLYFGVYSYSKEKLGSLFEETFRSNESDGGMMISESMLRTLTVASSAAIGNLIASFSRVPYEVVKQKLQTGQYSSTLTAMEDMFRQNGMRAFFPMGGVSIQMMRDIPYAVFTLLSYEFLRDHWVTKSSPTSVDESKTKPNTDRKPIKDMVAGGLAGGIGSYLTNPMDVIKTRLQTDSELYNGNVWICAKTTYEEGGMTAFLRGSVPRLIHKVPANAVFFVFYEFFRKVLAVDETKKVT